MPEPAARQSCAEYLEMEASSEEKHEYVDGMIHAMTGVTPEHSRLALSFGRLLGNALQGRPCAVFTSDARIRILATGRSTYPDLSVVCTRIEHALDDPHSITNPVVLVEVLSPSTESADRGDKWRHYQRLPSLQEYVLVGQEVRRVEVFRREGDFWTYRAVEDGAVTLESLGVSLVLDEIYRDPLAS